MHKHLNFFSRILVLFCVLSTLLAATPFAHAQLAGTRTSEETDAIVNPAPVYGSRGSVVEQPGERAAYLQTQANIASEDALMGSSGVNDQVSGTGSLVTGGPDAQTQAAIDNINGNTGVVDDTDSKIYNLAVVLGGWVVAAGGALFDLSIDKVVLKMGCWFRSPDQGYFQKGCSDTVGARGAVGGVVNELWSVVRDLFNILFIFALVWIGLRMILFADDSGTQRTLGALIAAALLINFSLYFTKAIVDVANFTAITIHEVAIGGISGEFGFDVGEIKKGKFNRIGDGETSAVGYTSDASIGTAYMQALKISSWFSGSPLTSTGEILVYSVILLLFSIILGITLAFGGIMLISRFIALVILMIFSPAMFLGWVLPGFKKYSSEWWNKFLGYAFFAPAYIFMLYLGLYTLIQLGNMVGQDTTYADAMGGQWSSEMFTIFLFYALGIGFLFAATKVGQSMSIAGSNAAMATTQGAMRRMRNGGIGIGKAGLRLGGAASLGLLARGGRNSLGYGAQKYADSDFAKDTASRKGISGSLARTALKGSRVVGNATFDARRVGGMGKKLGIGEGKSGGYKTQTDAIVKSERAFADSLGTVSDDDTAVKIMSEDKKKHEDKLLELKAEKEGMTGSDKASQAKRIKSEENNIKKIEEKIKQEKNRRQIGSAGDIEALAEEKVKFKATEEEIKVLRTNFRGIDHANRAARKAAVEAIKKKEKELKEIEKVVKKKSGSLGYAGVLEDRGFLLGSAWYGRILNQDKAAAKDIRKKYEKAAKKSKEDSRFDDVVSAVKNSK